MPSESEPRETLDPRARGHWRLTGLVVATPALVLIAAAAWLLWWAGVPLPFVLVPLPVALLLAAGGVLIVPDLLWRHWRYQVGEEEIDLQRGLLTLTRTLIPMARVQHVDMRRGPLQRRFGLASVVLYTAAGSSHIPGLAVDTAKAVRDRVAALANTRDDL